MNSVRWLMKQMLTFGLINTISWGKMGSNVITAVSECWSESQRENRRETKAPFFAFSTFSSAGGRELRQTLLIHLAPRCRWVRVSEGQEKRWLMGTSFTELLGKVFILPLAIIKQR